MLLAARGALESLSGSVERIQQLIVRLRSLLDDGVLGNSERPRARVRDGGGPSPLLPLGSEATRSMAPQAPTVPAQGPPVAPPPPRVTARELIVVSELAHAGYSRQEIAERLRAQWGDQAAVVLREALGESG